MDLNIVFLLFLPSVIECRPPRIPQQYTSEENVYQLPSEQQHSPVMEYQYVPQKDQQRSYFDPHNEPDLNLYRNSPILTQFEPEEQYEPLSNEQFKPLPEHKLSQDLREKQDESMSTPFQDIDPDLEELIFGPALNPQSQKTHNKYSLLNEALNRNPQKTPSSIGGIHNFPSGNPILPKTTLSSTEIVDFSGEETLVDLPIDSSIQDEKKRNPIHMGYQPSYDNPSEINIPTVYGHRTPNNEMKEEKPIQEEKGTYEQPIKETYRDNDEVRIRPQMPIDYQNDDLT